MEIKPYMIESTVYFPRGWSRWFAEEYFFQRRVFKHQTYFLCGNGQFGVHLTVVSIVDSPCCQNNSK